MRLLRAHFIYIYIYRERERERIPWPIDVPNLSFGIKTVTQQVNDEQFFQLALLKIIKINLNPSRDKTTANGSMVKVKGENFDCETFSSYHKDRIYILSLAYCTNLV